MDGKIRIAHLYPKELSLYGDNGNIICIKDTLQRLGFKVEINEININEPLCDFDFLFIGGGQDREIGILNFDIQKKSDALKYNIESEKVVLAVCAGYQILGEYYKTHDGSDVELSRALPFYTVGSKKRMIGNFVYDTPFGKVAGFENHSGKTYLSENLTPLGSVIKGFGNNAKDKSEGVLYKNTFATYAHGPVLPKNPELKYEIIKRILKCENLPTLDDKIDKKCHDELILRFT